MLNKEAERLAAQSYLTQIVREELANGKSVFVALIPELEGCMAQGSTVTEAVNELREVRIKYILHFLEHGLRIPGPSMTQKTSTEGWTLTATIELSDEREPATARLKRDVSPHMYEPPKVYQYTPDNETLVQVA